MKRLILIAAVLLAGCGQSPIKGEYRTDQAKRQGLFQDCLDRIPEGPKETVYNDWAEVVDSCDGAAYRMSQVWVEYQ